MSRYSQKNREVLDLLGVVTGIQRADVGRSVPWRVRVRLFVLLRRMRTLHFDAVIDCELFARISSILSFFSGAPRGSVSPHTQEGLYRGSYMNRPVLYNPYPAHIATVLDPGICARLRHPSVAKDAPAGGFPGSAPVRIPAGGTGGDGSAIARRFSAIQGKLWCVYPSGGILRSRLAARTLPVPFAPRCSRSVTLAVGIVVCNSDKPIARVLLDRCKSSQCVDLTGYTKSVRNCWPCFIARSLLITNDGGPVHFAALTPIPSIVFFGPETPVLYGSLSKNATVSIRRFPARLASRRTTTGPRRVRRQPCFEAHPAGTGAGQGAADARTARGAGTDAGDIR